MLGYTVQTGKSLMGAKPQATLQGLKRLIIVAIPSVVSIVFIILIIFFVFTIHTWDGSMRSSASDVLSLGWAWAVLAERFCILLIQFQSVLLD